MADLTLAEISNAMRQNIYCLEGLLLAMKVDKGTTQDLLCKKPPIGIDPTVDYKCSVPDPNNPFDFGDAFKAAVDNLMRCQSLIEQLRG